VTSRERVLAALAHREPDRVPIDLGGTIMSGIMAHALDRLRRHLGLEQRPVRVYEVFQMLGEVEEDVVERLGVDVLPVEPMVQFFGLRRERYKPWKLWDGTEVLVPGDFRVFPGPDGSLLIRNSGKPDGGVEGRMPSGGFYFDMPAELVMAADFRPPPVDEVRREQLELLSDEELEHLGRRARELRKRTDKALLLGAWGALGLGGVGSIPDWLMLLGSDKGYVRELFAARTEAALENLDRLWAAVGDAVDIVGLDGSDYGAQQREQFDPALFEELYVPFFRRQNDWIHAHTPWKSWQHTCGSVTRILPHLVESGVDILNPVQTTAAGMDPAWLKKTFGAKLTFWGGGSNTQKTLPFGTPEEVAEEVRRNIAVFAPGGGYVWNPVHNVQHGTPPENIAAAFDSAREAGRYPIRGA
jgi:hypothetical protein